jgi:hypothetical protein
MKRYEKVKERVKRYGPWEFRGTLWALGWGYLGSVLSHSDVVIGYAGARWENVGYYGYFVWREYRDQRYVYNQKVSFLSLAKGLVSEFGVWEVLDSAIIRPFTMWVGAKVGWVLWLLAGKLTADAIFYLSVTFFYYRKTKRNVHIRLKEIRSKIKHK